MFDAKGQHMNREQWQPFLKLWSEEWIAGHDELLPDDCR